MINFKHYQVPEEPADCQALLAELIPELQQDDRHILWLLEGAASAAQSEIKEKEADILRHKEFGRPEMENRDRERITRLTRNIRIFGCLHRLFFLKHLEGFFADVAASGLFGKKPNPSTKVAKR